MIYLILDPAREAGLEKYRELKEKFSKGRKIFLFDSVGFDPAGFQAIIESQSLFGEDLTIFCREISENSEALEILEKSVEKLAASPQDFVFLEKKLPPALEKRLLKSAERFWQFKKTLAPKNKWFDSRWNPFQLTDALAERDRRKLWILSQKALLSGVSPEEIFWKIFWQVKNLLVAKRSRNAQESGLSSYPYQKARVWAKGFSDQELENLSASLVSLYHDSRRGLADFETSLELLILSF